MAAPDMQNGAMTRTTSRSGSEKVGPVQKRSGAAISNQTASLIQATAQSGRTTMGILSPVPGPIEPEIASSTGQEPAGSALGCRKNG
jgi:hypothetical protein